MSSCQLNQIFLGEIASVQNYGAFVRIPGCKQQGLIHKSQVSSTRVDDVADVLQRGERVWCKVINISEDGKVGLSMKRVNQGNGEDLDPNGVEQQMDEQRRQKIIPRQKKAIELEAVFNTTCSKCGTRGHLANDCFTTPDGKKYDLIPEIEESPERVEEAACKPTEERSTRKKKKRKRDDSSSDESEDEKSHSERKKKKRRKKKSRESKKSAKRKRGKSREDSSSSDSPDNRESRRDSEKKAKKCKHSRSKDSD